MAKGKELLQHKAKAERQEARRIPNKLLTVSRLVCWSNGLMNHIHFIIILQYNSSS